MLRAERKVNLDNNQMGLSSDSLQEKTVRIEEVRHCFQQIISNCLTRK